MRVVTICLVAPRRGGGRSSGCGDVNAALEKVSEARRVAADLTVQFTKSADAANRAVMADTDEQSVAFAHESEQATTAVQSNVAALKPMLARAPLREGSPTARGVRAPIRQVPRARPHDPRPGRGEHEPQGAAALVRGGPAGSGRVRAVARRRWRRRARPTRRASTRSSRRPSRACARFKSCRRPHIAEAGEEAMGRIEQRMKTEETAAQRRARERWRTLIRPASTAAARRRHAPRWIDSWRSTRRSWRSRTATPTSVRSRSRSIRSAR